MVQCWPLSLEFGGTPVTHHKLFPAGLGWSHAWAMDAVLLMNLLNPSTWPWASNV